MKIVLRHPSGLHIEFEGEASEFDRFEGFLTGDLSGFMHGLEDRPLLGSENGAGEDEDASAGEDERLPDRKPQSGEIDARALHERMESVGATTDIDRVTVIAQAALDAGLEGVHAELGDRVYTELGIPKPSRWAKAFSNAKSRGLLRNVKHGVWRTTVNGENYARHGVKPTRPRAKRSAGSNPTRLALNSSSEED